ncbi:MAG: zinc-dependent alcohol dehydrogenase family protein [Parachlamydiaceae bacterium]
MKALVYQGNDLINVIDKAKPEIFQSTDCIVKMVSTTICGTDLHILKGDVPTVGAGRTLGHEGIGIIETKGDSVCHFEVGDRVLISCISSCGICSFCRKQMYSHCKSGGWQLGNTIDGTQAEYVRIPFADTSLHHLPRHTQKEENLCLFSDILPTGYETGVLRGKIKLGDRVAIVGAGPVGLAALLTAKLFSPTDIIVIDKDPYRLEVAQKLGATRVIENQGQADVIDEVFKSTDHLGVDLAIEAVGVPDTFELCQAIVAPGGHIANMGVHGKEVPFHLERLWSHNITLSTALVDTSSIPTLLQVFEAGKLTPQQLITHHFSFQDILEAYRVFKNAAKEKALKVIINF